MRFVTDHSKGILGNSDSVELWTQIIDRIPDSLLLKPDIRILNLSCGHCTEAVILAKRMLALGIDPEKVNNSFTLLDKYQVFTNPAKMLYGFENVITADWRNANLMNFNLIMANPPYQDGQANDEAHKLWPKIVKFAFEHCSPDGYVTMITPSTWMNPSNDCAGLSIYSDIFLNSDLQVVNISKENFSKHFQGVGSTFSWWIMKNSSYSGSTEIITDSETLNVDIQKHPSLPKEISHLSLSVVSKIQAVDSKFEWLPQRGYGSVSKELNSEHTHRYYHTPAKGGRWWWGSEEHPNARVPKILVSLSGKYEPIVDVENGYTSMCIVVLFDTQTEALNALTTLKSKLYRWYLNQFKHSGFNNIKACFSLPKLDLSKPWTDSDIYEQFSLTQDEINYIETSVK